MSLLRLSPEDVDRSVRTAELAMGLHIVGLAKGSPQFAYVIGDIVMIIFDQSEEFDMAYLLEQPWLDTRPRYYGEETVSPEAGGIWDRERLFHDWLMNLALAPPIGEFFDRETVMRFGLITPGYVPPPPARPSYVYGHLPFGWRAGANDVFYRYEPFPTSRRIDQVNRTIAPDTYGCPASEIPFIPSGFSAVGRYALPNLAPHCFRWELQPVAGTHLDCGASVPLYGQAGGGVEVRFRRLSHNRGPIANPVVLPAL